MKRFLSLFLCLILTVTTVACGQTDKNDSPNGAEDTSNGASGTQSTQGDITPPSVDLDFSGNDLDASFDASEATDVVFSENGIEIKGQGAAAEGCRLLLTEPGTYVLSGSCKDGKITVSVGENDKVKLVLDGLDLICKDGTALLVTEGDKVFLTLADGSKNKLADGASYTETVGETNVDGAIFSRADLTVNGSGTLSVSANNKHGIVSKDDLVLAGTGTLSVTSAGVALEGKDCVKIREMTLDLTSGGDGIRSTNTEDSSRGYVYVESGTLTIKSEGDGIQAETLLQIEGGSLSIVTGGGSENAPIKQGGDMMGGFRPGGNFGYTESTDTQPSRKGLKCTSLVLVNGGEVSVDAYDDGIHSDGDVSIAGGKTTVASGDDGIHGEKILQVTGGELTVKKSYEGLEACEIYIKDGKTSVTASDDGLNASDGSGGMMGGGFPGGMMGGGSAAYLCISGGYLLVDAAGDGLDSNGNFDMTGGTVLVAGPTNSGNGALDFGDGCTGSVSGGILIAVGASGMAENFTNAQNQGSMLVGTGTCQAGTGIAVCDENGRVLASFTPNKAYQCAVITAPGIKQGETYTVYAGADVANADENGFAKESTLSGGTAVATVEMTSLLYGSGMGGGMGGGMRPGGGGGMRPGRK
ncbi:MAG: carbohydrate-binding domain-containing protein [Ruminococcaceae bacterium]|nr:carbohydrate-binding domain-containing protein [Oscillospiraceae bacterium]